MTSQNLIGLFLAMGLLCLSPNWSGAANDVVGRWDLTVGSCGASLPVLVGSNTQREQIRRDDLWEESEAPVPSSRSTLPAEV